MKDEDLIRIAKKFMEDKNTCIAYNWADREISLNTIDEIREELRSAVKDEFQYKLGICGCGNPELVFEGIFYFLTIIRDRYNSDKLVSEEVEEKAMQAYKEIVGIGDGKDVNWPFLAMLYWLDDKEFTEHGTGIYGCWINELGKDYLLIFDDMKFHPGSMGKLWEDNNER